MAIIQIHLQCDDRFIEVLPEGVEHAELMVESLVTQVLLELFDTVTVDEVTIKQAPSKQAPLGVTLQCETDIDQARHGDLGATELLIENVVSQVWQELFGAVTVDEVTIKQLSSQREEINWDSSEQRSQNAQ